MTVEVTGSDLVKSRAGPCELLKGALRAKSRYVQLPELRVACEERAVGKRFAEDPAEIRQRGNGLGQRRLLSRVLYVGDARGAGDERPRVTGILQRHRGQPLQQGAACGRVRGEGRGEERCRVAVSNVQPFKARRQRGRQQRLPGFSDE
jgi:hypothetical protein